MIRRLVKVAVAAFLAVLSAASVASAGTISGDAGTTVRAGGARPQLTLIDQSGWVVASRNGRLVIKVRVTGALESDKIGVTVYRRLVNYTFFRETLANRRPTPEAAPEVLQPLSAMLADPKGGSDATFSIQVNPTVATAGAISIYATNPGVYPVQATLYDSDGVPLSELTTHLVWAPANMVSVGVSKLRVSLVVPVGASLSAGPLGAAKPLPAATSTNLGALVRALAAHPTVPLTIDATPQTLDALAAGSPADHQTLAALSQLARRSTNQVVAAPYVQLDLSALARSGLTQDVSTQLQLGSATVAARLGVNPSGKTWVAEGKIDSSTLALLAEDGFTRLVATAAAVKAPYSYTTLARPLVVGTRTQTKTPTLRADPNLARHLSNGSDQVLAAHQFLADLAMIQFEEPGVLRGVSVIIPPSWHPSDVFLDTVLSGLTGNSLLMPVTADQLFDSVPMLSSSGNSTAAALVAQVPSPPLATASALATARRQVQALSTVLPVGNPLPAHLDQALLVSEADSLTSTEQAALVSGVSSTVLHNVAGINIAPSVSITLTARQGRIPVTVTRTVGFPARVRIVLQSEKVAFRTMTPANGVCKATAGVEACTLTLVAPNTTLKVPLVTKTSGVFPLSVELESPDGGLLLVKSTYTLRSTAASGVGLVLLIGAALFLVVWWIRNLRDGRRNRDLVPSLDPDGDAAEPVHDGHVSSLLRLDAPEDCDDGSEDQKPVTAGSDGGEANGRQSELWLDDPVVAGFFASGPPDYPSLGWVGSNPSGPPVTPPARSEPPSGSDRDPIRRPASGGRAGPARKVQLFDQDAVDVDAGTSNEPPPVDPIAEECDDRGAGPSRGQVPSSASSFAGTVLDLTAAARDRAEGPALADPRGSCAGCRGRSPGRLRRLSSGAAHDELAAPRGFRGPAAEPSPPAPGNTGPPDRKNCWPPPEPPGPSASPFASPSRAAGADAGGSNTMSRNTAGMAVGTLLSRLTGFGRTLALAYAFGIARVTDVFNLANTVPNILYDLLVGGVLSATLIPVFVEQMNRRDGDQAEGARAVSAILTTVLVLLAALSAVFWLIAPLIIRLYLVLNHSAGLGDQRALGTSLLRLFVPQLFLLGGIALTTALYNARRQFKAPAFSPIVNNLLAIAAILLAAHVAHSVALGSFDHDRKAILILGLGTTVGYLGQFLLQLPALRHRQFRLRPTWDPRHPAVRTVLALSGWMFGAVVANQVSLYVIYIVADRRSGGVTAFQNAYQFFLLPYAIFAVSIASVITPDLADRWSSRDVRAFRARIAAGLRVTLAILVRAAVGYMLIARSFIDVLLRYGHVTAQGAHLTGSTLVMFAVGLPGFSAFLLLMRAYQSMQDARSMFWLYVFENAVTLILALALYPSLNVKGLALGWSAAYSIAAIAALGGLSRRTGGLEGVQTVVSLIKVGIATLAMALAVVAVTRVVGGGSDFRLAARVVAAVVCGVVVYLGVGRAIGLREIRLSGLRRA